MTVNLKSWPEILHLFKVQKFLTPIDNVRKDWLKQIFEDIKKLMDTAVVEQIKMLHYDELSVRPFLNSTRLKLNSLNNYPKRWQNKSRSLRLFPLC